ASWTPTLSTGLSDVIGSWKTIATSLPRIRRSSRFFSCSRSLPLNIAVPLAMRPGGWGIRPRIDRVLTLWPEPGSPTIPSVSRGKTSYEMSSTAWTIPSSVLNSTARFLIERIGSGTDPPLRRVERVAQAVADEVDTEHDQHDHQAREHRQPPLLRVRLRVGDEHAERRRRRLDPEAQERRRSLDEDRRADRKRAAYDTGSERVR